MFNYTIYVDQNPAPIAGFDSYDYAYFFAYEAAESYTHVSVVADSGTVVWNTERGEH